MSVDKAELCGPLLTWLQTFHTPPPCASPQDLSSGLAVAYVLNQIDPSWFNEAWLQGISEDPGHNWRLKVDNLKRILQSLVEYSQHVLGHPVSEQHLPDVSLIGQFSDPAELGKLLQLVLGCAISCEQKQEHIQRIMTLEESVQHVVMEAIQELMTKDTPDSLTLESYGNFDSQSRRYYFLSEEAEEGDELRQRCLDLERQLVLLSEEKQGLAQENAMLRERVGRPEGEGALGLTAKKLLLLQSQLEQLQEENFRLESSREDERQRCVELEREVSELQQRNQALTGLAHEAQALKDEMDELRTPQAHCQVQELQARQHEEAMKAEKWLFECRNLEEKYESVTKEKERLLAERDSLREANEELRCAQLQPRALTQADPSLDPSSAAVENLAAEILPTELRLNQQQLADLRAQVEDLQKTLQEQGGRSEDAISTLLKRKLEEHLKGFQPTEAGWLPWGPGASVVGKVMQTMEPKQPRPAGAAPSDLRSLRTQLRERDVRIRHLEIDFEKSRSQREQEERRLISAWYNMGMALQQRAGEEWSPAHAQSFLAQQRLATNARRGPLGRLASLTLRPIDKH
ncbi:protein Hook homolog 2 [Echinops telfairi]|uniref:Protein Hook homolog 2 n=1 Tax=Echinops telfairi TaxID=9371 RepID=A0ABM0J627_ECHTE|nr:protein Hook homolog 2 [Echinops telfairi]